jgi:hypothetical protein
LHSNAEKKESNKNLQGQEGKRDQESQEKE